MRDKCLTRKEANVLDRGLASLFDHDVIKEKTYSTGFIKRERRIKPVELMTCLLTCFGAGSLQWLSQVHRTYCSVTGRRIEYKPFHNQLRKPEFALWLKEILVHFMTRACEQGQLVPTGKKAQKFTDIVIHDGSSFALKESLSEVYPGRFTTTSPAAVELHCTLSAYGTVDDACK
jgi:hypothetical protein